MVGTLVRCGLAVPILCSSFAVPSTAFAQMTDMRVHVAVGSFRHLSDLHEYYRIRFDGATVLGAGVSIRAHRNLIARLGFETITTQLSGSPVFGSSRERDDHLLTGRIDVLGTFRAARRLEPYAGLGVGLRRSVVNTRILSGDIIRSPWSDPQIQPIASLLGGATVRVLRRIAVSGEVRWSTTRFRVAADTWGLPRAPVAWQGELQAGVRLEVSLR